MQKDWLVERVEDIITLEEKHRVRGDSRIPDVPFGFLNTAWTKLKAQMQPGDELWEFHSGKESFAKSAGRAGYSIVRNGVIVASLIVRMN